MKITQLRRLDADSSSATVRTTTAQDTQITDNTAARRRRVRWLIAGGAGLMLLGVLAWLAHAWSNSSHLVSRNTLSITTVKRGHFVRDVAAQGSVVASVNPTLFAIASSTMSYAVHAGDAVTQGEVLGTLDSPELRNEYQREQATLDSLNAALAHQEIEIRRQLLTSQQQADLAQVVIQAAERELKRAQWAWDLHAIPERDYRRAIDEVSTAKLNFDHAQASAGLERDSVVLDLRTKRLERDRQALAVSDLKSRVEQLTVRSPVKGMVANLAQPEKARVSENTPLLTVVDLTNFEVEFQVAESFAGDIKPRMAADITLGGQTVAGTVTAISPEVRQNEVTGRVKFNTLPPGLRQNERASVRIVLDERDDVVNFEHGSNIDEATRAVYVERGDRAIRTPVTLGPASISDIEVLRGLVPGDRVIISDTRDLNDTPELLIGK